MSPTTELLIKAVIKSLKEDKFIVDAWSRQIEYVGDREEFLLVATKAPRRRRKSREVQLYAKKSHDADR